MKRPYELLRVDLNLTQDRRLQPRQRLNIPYNKGVNSIDLIYDEKGILESVDIEYRTEDL